MRTPFALLLLGTLSTGCGFVVGSSGEMGNLQYTLVVDYDMDGEDLDETTILTRHEQYVSVALTSDGEDECDTPSAITHELVPGEGVHMDLEQDYDEEDEDASDATDFSVAVDEGGTYRLESWYDGELLDYIDLTFEKPDALDLVTYLRGSGDEEFHKSNVASPSVVEGDQATFIPVPVDDDDERIAGDFTVELSAEPEGMVVMDYDILDSYEDDVFGSFQAVTVWFLDPGEVTITLADSLNGTSTSQIFEVADYPTE